MIFEIFLGNQDTFAWFPTQSSPAVQLLLDALFAAFAGMGFGAISNPPKRLLCVSGILAAVGHSLRYFLMNFCGMEIASATLIGAFVIGFGAWIAGRLSGNPAEVFSFPALLPFVPGMKAYYAVIALLKLLRSDGDAEMSSRLVSEFFSNALVAGFVLIAIVLGASMSVFIDTLSTKREHRKLFSLRRSRKNLD